MEFTATTRYVVAAAMAAMLGLPAAVPATDGGGARSNAGGGATYEEPAAGGERISLRVARGTWLRRVTRVTGTSGELAGRTVSIQRRRPGRGRWSTVASARVRRDGVFAARWKPVSAGRHELRAVATSASSSNTGAARAASAAARVTVYRRVTATWYGPGFYGNRTACGQRLTRRTQGVAHKTLPCGTRVAIRANGRSAVVPVIDRGPYARGIEYDLASATARRLGVTHTARIGAAVVAR